MHSQDVRQLRARHDAVLRAIAGAEPADGAERLLAALPQLQPLFGVLRLADFAGPALLADLDDAVALLVEPASRPSTSISNIASASSGKPK